MANRNNSGAQPRRGPVHIVGAWHCHAHDTHGKTVQTINGWQRNLASSRGEEPWRNERVDARRRRGTLAPERF
jgi:hypothetical protein